MTSRSGTRPTRRPTGPRTTARRRTRALLARCYDVLHDRPGPINVISSTASRHDPASFVFDLGDAYRASGRTRPLFDTFGHNPYPADSAEPPWVAARELGPDRGGRLRDSDERPAHGLRGHAAARAGHPRRDDLVRRGRLPDRCAARQAALLPRPRERPARDSRAGAAQTTRTSSTRRRSCATRSCSRTASRLSPDSSTSACSTRTASAAGKRASSGATGLAKPSYDTFKAAIAEVRRRDTDCSKIRGAPSS